MVELNLLMEIGQILAAENHLTEAGEMELLDDCRFVRQCLSSSMVKNKNLWCGLKHLLIAYVNNLELIQKQVRNKRNITKTYKTLGHLQQLIEKVCERVEKVEAKSQKKRKKRK